MRPPQNAELLSKGGDRLAPRLVAMLNMRDGVTFHAGVDLKKAASFEEAPNAVVRSPLSECSRVPAIMPY